MKQENNQLMDIMQKIDVTLEPYFLKKAPQLPSNIQELLAKITPYLTVLGVVFGAFGLLIALGVSSAAMPFLAMANQSQAIAGGILGLIILAIQVILEAMALQQGLFKFSKKGWNLLYMSALVGLAYDLVTINIIGFLIHFLITFYLLYQIKHLYNK